MWTYRLTAADRQTGREVRLELDALSEAEAAQIVTRFALVRRIEQVPRRDPAAASTIAAARAPAACPRCGQPLDAPVGVIGGPAPAAVPDGAAGPRTAIGTVSPPLTFERTVGGRRISIHQMLGGSVALMGLPLLVFGLILSGRPEPEASRGDSMMVTAGVLLAVGLGWLVVGSLLGSREPRE
jgi:hypothetical protein